MSIKENILNMLSYIYRITIPIMIAFFTVFKFNDMSFIVYSMLLISCISIVGWTTLNNLNTKIPSQPILYLLLGIFLTISLTIKNLEGSIIDASNIGESLLVLNIGIFGGILIWLFINVLITIIVTSVTDISPDKDTSIDDSYNDPHAARILNENEEL